MNYRKMFLVSENEFNEFKEDKKGKEMKVDQKMNQFNQKYIEDKIANQALNDAEWGKLGAKISPIIKQGIISSRENEVAPGPSPESLINVMKKNVSPTLLPKAVKLISFFEKVPEIDLSPQGISVNGVKLLGSFEDIIEDLVKSKKNLTYDMFPLLAALSSYPAFQKLIYNKEALDVLKNMNKVEAGAFSSPISMRRDESDDIEEDYVDEDLFKTPKEKATEMSPYKFPIKSAPFLQFYESQAGTSPKKLQAGKSPRESPNIKTRLRKAATKKTTPKGNQKGSGKLKVKKNVSFKKSGKKCPKKSKSQNKVKFPNKSTCVWESLFG